MDKILYISYDGLTDILGKSQILPYIVGLTKYGYAFTIISFEKRHRKERLESDINNIIKGLPIDWVPLTYHRNPPILSSIFDYITLLIKSIYLHKQNNFSLVHTRPGIPPLVALYLKKKYNLKYLNDVRGFWADERVDGGLWNLDNPIYKSVYNFFKEQEQEALRLNDYTTCLTQKAKHEIVSWGDVSENKLDVIPCSVDFNLFDPNVILEEDQNSLRRLLNINPGDFVLSYLGSVGTWYLMDDMFLFFSMLVAKNSNSKFMLIIPSEDHGKALNYIKKHNIDNSKVIILELERHNIPIHLSLSSYSIFFIKPCYSKISSSPTKHGEIMAMGIPLITNSGVGDVKEIVDTTNSGYVVDSFSEEAFEEAIEHILSTKYDKSLIRNSALPYYSLQNAITLYSNVYRKMIL